MTTRRVSQRRVSEAESAVLLKTLLTAPDAGDPRQGELLAALLATPLPPAPAWRASSVIKPNPRATLQPAHEDRLDRLLLRGAQFAGVGALAFCGYWFVAGPLGNWYHSFTNPPSTRPQTTQLAAHISELAEPQRSPTPQLTLPRALPTAQTLIANPEPAEQEHLAKVALDAQIGGVATLGDTGGAAPTPGPAPTSAPAPPAEAPPAAPAEAAAPVSRSPNWLVIPAIGVDTPVIETFYVDDVWQAADYAAGYLTGTGVPGEVGNVVISGHAGLMGGVFARLGELMPGATIYVERPGWRFTYVVSGQQVVWPTQIEVMLPEDTPMLTLITCTNWDTQRLIVVANLVSGEPLPE